ncbi:hypothetical protein B0A69_17410 [Chryseobacterium shigense]|uniref:Uncharacterized protein n=1 Tax=Chryseobacterium shigense TaxID=297244 RepID=A0A1N7IDH0_9FLAO|nr:hypothetical protein [Chryseobacterium shigense]PQA91579.1 hypothetical protein B0A69_17410 [Chryseobacterium shigense]SIS35061.1 hypothetical protein SAMN05421639_103163 [Chryseobacterium shigense]
MKSNFTFTRKAALILGILFFVTAFAQEARPGQPIKGVIVKGGKNPGGNLLISAGGGGLFPGNTYGLDNHVGNGFNGNINLYVPLLTMFPSETNSVSLGLNGGAGFFRMKKDYNPEGPVYHVAGQSAPPSLKAEIADGSKQSGFIAEAGVQSNFSFSKFTVSPIVNLAYISSKESQFTAVQTSNVNGQTRTFETSKKVISKTDGLGVIPKLRLSYFPGRVGFFVEGSYLMGPDVQSTTTIFKPNGPPNGEGFYSIDQMTAGKYETVEMKNRFNALGLNVGVIFSIPSKKQSVSPKKSEITEELQSKSGSSCVCVSSPVASVQFPNVSGPSINPGGTLTIPYNAANSTKFLRIEASPHPYNSLNTGTWASIITIFTNGNASAVSPAGNPFTHTGGQNPSVRLIPFSSLNQGVNTICISVKCPYSGTTCSIACFTVIVEAPPAPSSGTITTTPVCCTRFVVVPGNPHKEVLTGQVKFKMAGTVVNAKLKIVSAGGVVTYENFVQNGFTACYTMPVEISVVSNTNLPVASSTVNGIPVYKYSVKFGCKELGPKLPVQVIPGIKIPQ